MEKKKTPLSFHVIHWIMTIITGLFAVISILAVVFYILLYTDVFGNDLQLHIDLPGEVSFCNTGTLEYDGGIVEVELVEARTKIHFINTPTSLARQFILILLGVCAFIFYILLTFQQFFARVRKGEVFSIDNILRLQNISYVLLGFWVYFLLYRHLTYHYITTRLDFENVEIIKEIDSQPWILLLALFIWVLSHVFLRGLRLKEEQDLTI